MYGRISVPDNELRKGSHWRIEGNNLETRWRLSQAFINATRIGDNQTQAVTTQKPWGGTSDGGSRFGIRIPFWYTDPKWGRNSWNFGIPIQTTSSTLFISMLYGFS